jgi:hypothetical protein
VPLVYHLICLRSIRVRSSIRTDGNKRQKTHGRGLLGGLGRLG